MAGLLDALPPTLRGRWGMTAHHVTVVALVVGSALVVAAWWLLRAQPEPVEPVPVTRAQAASSEQSEVPASPDSAESDQSAPESAKPQGSGSSASELVVHVAGKVRQPGIVSLPAGSRVIDALQEAGGPRRNVDLSSLNLARSLADGEQIVVGVDGAVPPSSPSATGGDESSPGGSGASAGPVNLNTATSEQLEELPGVGPVTAASIIDWRTEHGQFSSVEELLEVSGIGDATLADLRDLVTV